MHAFQALLRNQCLRHRDRYDRSGGVHRRRQANRPHLRRDQSRRHKSSRMFRDRTAARRGAGHSGHARRPARNGDHRLGSAHQRDAPERETHRRGADRRQRRRCGRHRLCKDVPRARRAPRPDHDVRQPGRSHDPPHRPQLRQARIRDRPAGHDAARSARRRRRLPGRFDGRRARRRHGAVDGRQPAGHGAGESRSRNLLRRGQGGTPRRDRRNGPYRLPQSGEQRAGIPLHLPRRTHSRSWHARRFLRSWLPPSASTGSNSAPTT